MDYDGALQEAQNFDNTLFAWIFLEYGVAFVFSCGFALYIVSKIHWKASMVYSFLALKLKGAKFHKMSFVFRWLLAPFTIAPVPLLVLWGVMVALNFNPMFMGLTIITLGLCVLFFIYGFMQWKSAAYRMTRSSFGYLCAGFASFASFQMLSIFLIRPFTFLGVSSIFLAYNMFPMIVIIYMNQIGVRVDFEELIKGTTANKAAAPIEVAADRKSLVTLCYYLLSVAILIVYAMLVQAKAEVSDQTGWVIIGTILFLDVLVFLFYQAGLVVDPTVIVSVCIICRFMLVMFGESLWFVAQSCVYAFFGTLLSYCIVNQRYPKVGDKCRHDHDDLIHTSKRTVVALPSSRKSEPSAAGILMALLTSYISMFVMLTIAFGVLLAFVATGRVYAPDVLIAQNDQPQFLFGIFSFFITLVFLFSLLSMRKFSSERAKRKNHWGSFGYFVLAWVLAGGGGALLFVVTGSTLLLLFCVFPVPVFFLTALWFVGWKANDYDVYQARLKRPDRMCRTCCCCACVCFGRQEGGMVLPDPLAIAKAAIAKKLKQSKSKSGKEQLLEESKVARGLPPSPAKRVKDPQRRARSVGEVPSDEEDEYDEDESVEDEEVGKRGGGPSKGNSNGKGQDRGKNRVIIDDDEEDEQEEEQDDEAPNSPLAARSKAQPPSRPLPMPSSYKRGAAPSRPVTSPRAAFGDLEPDSSMCITQFSRGLLCCSKSPQDPRRSKFIVALFLGGLSPKDYLMSWGLLLLITLVLGWGLLTALLCEPMWIGVTIPCVFFSVAPIAYALVEHFGTLEVRSTVWGNVVAGVGVWGTYGWYMYELGDRSATARLLILLLEVALPIALLTCTALYKWKDDKWKVSPFVVYNLFGTCCLLVAFAIAVMFFVGIQPGVLLLLAILVAIYFLCMFAVWVRNGFYLPRQYKSTLTFVYAAVVGVGVFMAISTNRFFVGLTVILWSGTIACSARAISFFSSASPETHTFSKHVLPVYRYDPRRDMVIQENAGAEAIYYACGLALVWGNLAVLFQSPPAVGLATTSFALLVAVTFSADKLFEQAIELSRIMPYATPRLIRKMLKKAADAQLGGDEPFSLVVEDPSDSGTAIAAQDPNNDANDSDSEDDLLSPTNDAAAGATTSGGHTFRTVGDLLQAAALLHKALDEGGVLFDLNGNPQTAQQAHVELLEMERLMAVAYHEQTKFAAHFQFLVANAARFKREQRESEIIEILRSDPKYKEITINDVRMWQPKEQAMLMAEYDKLKEIKRQDAVSRARRRQEDETAQRKREEAIRRLQEQNVHKTFASNPRSRGPPEDMGEALSAAKDDTLSVGEVDDGETVASVPEEGELEEGEVVPPSEGEVTAPPSARDEKAPEDPAAAAAVAEEVQPPQEHNKPDDAPEEQAPPAVEVQEQTPKDPDGQGEETVNSSEPNVDQMPTQELSQRLVEEARRIEEAKEKVQQLEDQLNHGDSSEDHMDLAVQDAVEVHAGKVTIPEEPAALRSSSSNSAQQPSLSGTIIIGDLEQTNGPSRPVSRKLPPLVAPADTPRVHAGGDLEMVEEDNDPPSPIPLPRGARRPRDPEVQRRIQEQVEETRRAEEARKNALFDGKPPAVPLAVVKPPKPPVGDPPKPTEPLKPVKAKPAIPAVPEALKQQPAKPKKDDPAKAPANSNAAQDKAKKQQQQQQEREDRERREREEEERSRRQREERERREQQQQEEERERALRKERERQEREKKEQEAAEQRERESERLEREKQEKERQRKEREEAKRKKREEEERLRREREEEEAAAAARAAELEEEKRKMAEAIRRKRVTAEVEAPTLIRADALGGQSIDHLPEDKKDALIVSQMQKKVKAIVDECKRKKAVFVDTSFPADERSLYMPGEDGEVHPHGARIAQWLRPREFEPAVEQPVVFQDGVNPADIEQGALGDCWFLSALSVLALEPDRVRNILITPEPNEAGVFSARFYKGGQWVQVIIDDLFPCDAGGRPAYGRSKEESEMWVMLLEKAYAKLHTCYEAMEGGMVHIGLVDMTGGTGEEIVLDNKEVQKDIMSGSLWSKLLRFREQGYLMGAGSPAGSDTEVSEQGIVQGHAYAVLDVQEVDGNKLIRLRNPWGHTEWTGPWSDGSPEWSKRVMNRVQYAESDDGAFWMCFEDFSRNYHSVYVCRLFGDQWFRRTIESEWAGASAGGALNNATGRNNPQFSLMVQRPTTCFIVLAQEECRGFREYHHICFLVLKKDGKRASTVKKSQVAAMSGTYTNVREVSKEVFLDPMPTPYTVFPSTFKAGLEARFTISVYSDHPVDFVLMPDTIEAI